MAINHLSYSDWLFVPLVVERRVTFVAKSEYFTTPGVKGRLQKGFFSGTGQVPIDRTSGSAAAGALATGKRILAAGELFGIFPEGTRSPDGRLYKGKTGIARLALESGVPVIPVALMDTDTVAPPGEKFGRYAQPHVRFGAPLDFSRFDGMGSDRFVLRSITDEIMYELMLLSGQEYVDEYAASRKKSVGERARSLGEGAVQVAKEIQGSATAALEDAAARLPRKGSDKDGKDIRSNDAPAGEASDVTADVEDIAVHDAAHDAPAHDAVTIDDGETSVSVERVEPVESITTDGTDGDAHGARDAG
nr:lysophospholipid acyltransferase family protein [Dermacoccus nishinomiyaensis]